LETFFCANFAPFLFSNFTLSPCKFCTLCLCKYVHSLCKLLRTKYNAMLQVAALCPEAMLQQAATLHWSKIVFFVDPPKAHKTGHSSFNRSVACNTWWEEHLKEIWR
jgi:hypothetical protein